MQFAKFGCPGDPGAGSTGPAPVFSASAASRLVSPTTRGAVPQGPRRSPWSQPEKVSPSPRRSPRLQWKTERESPRPSLKIGTGNTGNSSGATGTGTGILPKRREMRAASAESLSPEKTGKSPWPILLGRQQSLSSFSGDTISYGRRSNGWAALQCQEVIQTMEPFRQSLQMVLSDPKSADLQHLHSQCKLMVAAANGLQQALESEKCRSAKRGFWWMLSNRCQEKPELFEV